MIPSFDRCRALFLALCFAAGAAQAQTALPTTLVPYPSTISTMPLASISADGRYVAYRLQPNSSAPPGYPTAGNIFVYDRVANTTVQADITPSGTPGAARSNSPVISHDGRYVLFFSTDTAMGLPAGSSSSGLFLRDLQAGTTELIVSGTDNVSCCTLRLRTNAYAGLSPTGRYVVYRIEDNDKKVAAKLYMWDRETKVTTLLNAINAEFYNMDERIDISTDGRYIAYTGRPLVTQANDVNVYVHDRLLGSTEIANLDSAGVRQGPAMAGRMSADGSAVVFQSTARGYSPVPETSDNYDIFVRDRATGLTERISGGTGSQNSLEPSISPDGRHVAYNGRATANGKVAIWVYDRLAKASRGGLPTGIPAAYLMRYPTVPNGGQHVAMYAHYSISNPATRYMAILDFSALPAMVLSPSGPLQLVEGDIARTYSVALTRAPLANVTVNLAVDNQLSASISQLLFTAANWDQPQLVSVLAVQDNISEAPHFGYLTHSAASADPFFAVAKTGILEFAIRDAVAPVVAAPGTPGQPLQTADASLNGSAAPGATVLLTLTESASGNVQAVSVVANGEGQWLYTFLGLANSGYTVTAEADGIQGNTVAFSVYVQRDQQ